MEEAIVRGFKLGYAVVIWSERNGVFETPNDRWSIAYLTDEWEEVR